MKRFDLSAWRRSCALAILLLTFTGAQSQEKDKPQPADEPTIKLLEPGAEPRRELRYQFKPTGTVTMVMGMKMSMSMQFGEIQSPMTSMPRMENRMEIKTETLDPDGNLQYSFTLTKSGIAEGEDANPQIQAVLEKDLKAMEGMTGSATVTPRGLTKEAEINIPPTAPKSIEQMIQNLKQSIRQMSIPLPEEAVGVGAKWEIQSDVKNADISLTQTMLATLEAMDESSCKIKVAMKQSAEEQELKAPTLPPGATLTLKSLASDGDTSLDIDLTSLVPKSHGEISSTSVMEVDQNGQQQSVTMKMNMSLDIAPEAPE